MNNFFKIRKNKLNEFIRSSSKKSSNFLKKNNSKMNITSIQDIIEKKDKINKSRKIIKFPIKKKKSKNIFKFKSDLFINTNKKIVPKIILNKNHSYYSNDFQINLYQLNKINQLKMYNKYNNTRQNTNILKIKKKEKEFLNFKDIEIIIKYYNEKDYSEINSYLKYYFIFNNLNNSINKIILKNSLILNLQKGNKISKENYYLILYGSINIYKFCLLLKKYNLYELKTEGNLLNIEKYYMSLNDKNFKYIVNENTYLIKFEKNIFENFYLSNNKDIMNRNLNFLKNHKKTCNLKLMELISLASFLKMKKKNINYKIKDSKKIIFIKEGNIKYYNKNNIIRKTKIYDLIIYKTNLKIINHYNNLEIFYWEENKFNKIFNSLLIYLKNNLNNSDLLNN